MSRSKIPHKVPSPPKPFWKMTIPELNKYSQQMIIYDNLRQGIKPCVKQYQRKSNIKHKTKPNMTHKRYFNRTNNRTKKKEVRNRRKTSKSNQRKKNIRNTKRRKL
jgi:hypothetical protein